MTYFVLVQPLDESTPPWVLNLDGYPNAAAARRAINWQIQFNPYLDYTLWDAELLRDTGRRLAQGPYTDEAWAAWREKYL